ncbi:MAG: lipid-A-disaccharide synthase-related protein [Phormidesmis sp.]
MLCVSNGHGEDVIALRILTPLRSLLPSLALAAMPIAGEGSAYRAAGLPIVGPVQVLPSGGFLNRDPKQLARDVRQGLLPLTRSQLSALKAWAQTGDAILAVGDIVPLLFAYLSGLPYFFVGTAKSEYWLRDERGKLPVSQPFPQSLWEKVEGWSGSVYLPWERWLMSRDRAQTVFVRDLLTAQQLQQLGINAYCAGNPMMDNLEPAGKLTECLKALRTLPPINLLDLPTNRVDQASRQSPNGADTARATARYVTKKQHLTAPLTIALLPGSRPLEAYENWDNILKAIPNLTQCFPYRPLILLSAIAPNLSLKRLQTNLSTWQSIALADCPYLAFSLKGVTLLLITDAYSDCLHQAEIAIATAGTATEQFVGLGKPVITLPGKGPQFTSAFATVQAKMLGPSIQMVNTPAEIGPAVAKIISDPDRLQLVYHNGRQRMGEPGAGRAIAQKIAQKIA